MYTYVFINTKGEELEVDCDGFEEACHIMFSGDYALDPKDWELDRTE